MGRSKVELFAAIRRDARREEMSIRGLAERHGVHRRTVRQALASAVPPERKTPSRVAPVMVGSVRELIDGMLREDLDAPRKQRHTAVRVHARLVEEHGLRHISYSTVRDYVRVRRPEIFAEGGALMEEAFVPQVHEPGAQAEVDFADLWVVLGGVKTKLFLFSLRLSYSGRAVHRVYASQSQESFLDGHVAAFEAFGGVPVEHVRYDNLKSAVSRVLFGRNRIESDRWITFRSHYQFEAFYCRPGKEGAHEKGGVEGEGGRFRRTHLVPMPRIESVAALNAALARYDAADDARRIGFRTSSVGEDFAFEAGLLRPLPAEPFEIGLTLQPRVDRHSRVSVRQSYYSVPARFIGRKLRVLLRAQEVLAFDGARVVARHERARCRGAQVLSLDHYLEILMVKPGALPGARALSQARASGVFTVEHEQFWAAARAARGDRDGTRALIEVLLLHRRMTADAVRAGIRAALAVASTNPDLVEVEARRAGRGEATGGGTLIVLARSPGSGPDATGPDTGRDEAGADLGRRLGALPGERPLPSVTAYDDLLHRRG